MRSVVFPYQRWGARFAPIVPVSLFGRAHSVQTEAYVDSGALFSIFRLELLTALGLNKEEGRRHFVMVGDGGLIVGYLFRLPVQIGDVRLRARIAFSEKLNVGFNLLGRQTIFDQFTEVAFLERARQIAFRLR